MCAQCTHSVLATFSTFILQSSQASCGAGAGAGTGAFAVDGILLPSAAPIILFATDVFLSGFMVEYSSVTTIRST
jgi:hypothetical protein